MARSSFDGFSNLIKSKNFFDDGVGGLGDFVFD